MPGELVIFANAYCALSKGASRIAYSGTQSTGHSRLALLAAVQAPMIAVPHDQTTG